MEAKSPIRHHGRRADNLAVLLSDFHGTRSGEEVEVDDATKRVVLEVLPSFSSIVDLKIHSIAVEEEHAVRFVICHAMLKVDRMVSVQIGSWWNLVGIARPQCSCVIGGVQAERIRVLPKSIERWVRWERCPQSQVLRFEDQFRNGGVEYGFISLLALNSKRKRIGDKDKVKRGIGSGAVRCRIWTTDYRARNLRTFCQNL